MLRKVLTRVSLVSLSEGGGARLAAMCSDFQQDFPCLSGISVLAVVESVFSPCFVLPVRCEATGKQTTIWMKAAIKQLECINNSSGAGSCPFFILSRCSLSSRWCCAALWTSACLEVGMRARARQGEQEEG